MFMFTKADRLLSAMSPAGGRVMTENCINLMNLAPRCRAHSKRSGQACKAPAVRGHSVCHKHGAGGGAPEGKRNGNYRHGANTKRLLAALAAVRLLGKESRMLIEAIDN
jgi:hypothetical protein